MELTVQQTPLEQLVPYARNARTHSDKQVAQIAASITEFGFVNPVLIGADKIIIAGHGRVLAAQQLGLETVPTITLTHLNDNQRRALIIADNKLTENAGWDEGLLRLELQNLVDEDFNIDLLGFNDVDLDALLADIDTEITESVEETCPEPHADPVSQTGDVWILGDHRLLCGDATDPMTLQTLLNDTVADMVFTDPPYNVNYGHSVRDSVHIQRGRVGGRTILNDNMDDDSFELFLEKTCHNLLTYSQGAVYICMASNQLSRLQRAFCKAGGKYASLLIWAKNKFNLTHSDYHRQYECILYGWKKGQNHYWCGARDQSDLWFCDKPNKSEWHPSTKPVALVIRAIKNSSKPHDIVLDPFAGSGTTLIAAEQTGRQARLIELDPKYVDVIIQRWQTLTGQKAYLEKTQQTYDVLLAEKQTSSATQANPGAH